MKLTSSMCIALSVLLVICGQARAHAFLDHADPKVGSVVTASPTVIKIWFTQEIEPDFSVIEVRDSQGNQVDKKDSHVDANDDKLLIVSLPALADGDYAVSWKVVSVDTHHTQGDFKFTIKSGK
jgi:methionine-rich copper-binding protein CopC